MSESRSSTTLLLGVHLSKACKESLVKKLFSGSTRGCMAHSKGVNVEAHRKVQLKRPPTTRATMARPQVGANPKPTAASMLLTFDITISGCTHRPLTHLMRCMSVL